MIVLLAFALLAGAATAITPCVLPVLPALLSASGSGGRRRPLGVVAGLTLTHTITIVGIASVVDGVGFADGTLRTLAIVVLGVFGLTLLVPRASHWIETRLAAMSRLGPRSAGDGFWSGLPVGGALGFVYAPCAGPILAAVISVSASRGTTGELVAVGVAYGLGSAVVLLGLALGGRRVMGRVRRGRRGPVVQRAFGAVMVLTALLMFGNLDIRFQSALASEFPGFLTNPTGGLERSAAVEDRLADLRGKSRFKAPTEVVTAPAPRPVASSDAALPGVTTPALPVLGAAPEFRDTQRWFNSPPLTMRALRGRVVLVDFWTYTCINCLRTLPYVKAWDARYRSRGLTIVGVHTPEFAFEKQASNVQRAIGDTGLRYPVVQDNDFGTWNAFTNQAWPAKYLVDARGGVRYVHLGEGEYRETEAAIRTLLAEAGERRLGAASKPRGRIATVGAKASPETYLGSARAQGFSPVGPRDGTRDYEAAAGADLPQSVFSLGGRWHVDAESARAVRGASITARVVGTTVYLVLSSQGDRPRRVRVLLDGRSIARAVAGADVHDAVVTVRRQRLYSLVRLPAIGERVLTLRLDPGVSAYAFTFG
ncbi:MAG TPA: cytochrome c biogenesis protein DipZ [Solirubrobacteraceae bacterium]|jgi:cytochrome c biogenesis protein CcdA/thiol-disulfide isomerase/thioredoxin|nr:cytochrome c biogenesis protein DipZ [Solirubrobacteraceae bacterium]